LTGEHGSDCASEGYLDIDAFAKSRPYVFHLTDRNNVELIAKRGGMSAAALLMERAGRRDLVRKRRRQHERLTIGGNVILVRDQAPLHEGNMALSGGYGYADLIESINKRIFFWPGTARGPISYGVRHFERYREECPLMLRINIKSLLNTNPNAEPKFCRYNSGSPRCSSGQKSPRGPDTFISASKFIGIPSSVVEVTFENSLIIPRDIMVAEHPEGPWQPLYSSAAD
jgi:hypothetical protein